MSRRYLMLLAIAAAAALGVGVLARRPRASRAPAPAAAAIPVLDLEVTFDAMRVTPEQVAVPKGHRVRLRLANAAAVPLTIRLSGYEDRVTTGALAAGAAWRGEFIADLPGEDFAWLVNGTPRGRVVVTGSHLIEGHR